MPVIYKRKYNTNNNSKKLFVENFTFFFLLLGYSLDN